LTTAHVQHAAAVAEEVSEPLAKRRGVELVVPPLGVVDVEVRAVLGELDPLPVR